MLTSCCRLPSQDLLEDQALHRRVAETIKRVFHRAATFGDNALKVVSKIGESGLVSHFLHILLDRLSLYCQACPLFRPMRSGIALSILVAGPLVGNDLKEGLPLLHSSDQRGENLDGDGAEVVAALRRQQDMRVPS